MYETINEDMSGLSKPPFSLEFILTDGVWTFFGKKKNLGGGVGAPRRADGGGAGVALRWVGPEKMDACAWRCTLNAQVVWVGPSLVKEDNMEQSIILKKYA